MLFFGHLRLANAKTSGLSATAASQAVRRLCRFSVPASALRLFQCCFVVERASLALRFYEGSRLGLSRISASRSMYYYQKVH